MRCYDYDHSWNDDYDAAVGPFVIPTFADLAGRADSDSYYADAHRQEEQEKGKKCKRKKNKRK